MLFLLKSTDFLSSSFSNDKKIHHVECFLYGIMLTIKFFSAWKQGWKTGKQKKGGKKHFLQLCDQAL
jgi:hypothetical protein